MHPEADKFFPAPQPVSDTLLSPPDASAYLRAHYGLVLPSERLVRLSRHRTGPALSGGGYDPAELNRWALVEMGPLLADCYTLPGLAAEPTTKGTSKAPPRTSRYRMPAPARPSSSRERESRPREAVSEGGRNWGIFRGAREAFRPLWARQHLVEECLKELRRARAGRMTRVSRTGKAALQKPMEADAIEALLNKARRTAECWQTAITEHLGTDGRLLVVALTCPPSTYARDTVNEARDTACALRRALQRAAGHEGVLWAEHVIEPDRAGRAVARVLLIVEEGVHRAEAALRAGMEAEFAQGVLDRAAVTLEHVVEPGGSPLRDAGPLLRAVLGIRPAEGECGAGIDAIDREAWASVFAVDA